MLAGGTGITPMLQLINSSPEDVKYTVIFSNSTQSDIIINKDLLNDKNNVYIYHLISKMDRGIQFNSIETNINKDILNKQKIIFSRLSLTLIQQITKERSLQKFDFVYCCGPNEYMGDICGMKAEDKSQGEVSGILKELGYVEKEVYKF